jgi:hypothetical protein
MVDRGFRFHDNLIYGRRGDADEGEGIAIIKACSFSCTSMLDESSNRCFLQVTTGSGAVTFVLITYLFPILSE